MSGHVSRYSESAG